MQGGIIVCGRDVWPTNGELNIVSGFVGGAYQSKQPHSAVTEILLLRKNPQKSLKILLFAKISPFFRRALKEWFHTSRFRQDGKGLSIKTYALSVIEILGIVLSSSTVQILGMYFLKFLYIRIFDRRVVRTLNVCEFHLFYYDYYSALPCIKEPSFLYFETFQRSW